MSFLLVRYTTAEEIYAVSVFRTHFPYSPFVSAISIQSPWRLLYFQMSFLRLRRRYPLLFYTLSLQAQNLPA